jgi:carbonic anhydrase/acetyltransferase-like protein (isoleucine patch superfamily)
VLYLQYTYKGIQPSIHPTVYVAPGARIIGDVKIGEGSSIWFNTVLRGDEGPITIGSRVNIQDGCTGHQYSGCPLVLEDDVSVGHNVILHGCIVRKGALVGMGSILLDGAEIGEYAFIGAGTLVPPGKKIPPRTMVMGSPAKVIRELTDEDLRIVEMTTETYFKRGQEYLAESLQKDETNK